ncbi:choice-of-anchor I family protein [Marinoscillum furvescens]|uniref:Putative secreted protein (Por secretion system target) n=1 Tax=Marinoscillum furvescens DSM 4134 TaxID=1122208 RepID=A0A3D9L5P8_MARFU|nr:choice-of-anchor I family protein [Marinoscillum furvescens]REE00996.1 putative secreted protein (Por secretion system target) [Marinoscillum furvescens DSM 4134]
MKKPGGRSSRFLAILIGFFILGLSASYAQTDVSLELFITQEEDAAEEQLESGEIDFASSDLEFGSEFADGGDPQRVGVRFRGLDLPSDAEITSAYIQFTVDENGKNVDPCVQTIYIEDNANASAFTADAKNLTDRSTAETTVSWSIEEGSWSTVGESGQDQRTPDLSGLIASVLNSDEWEAGNAIAFFFEGSGLRTAESAQAGIEGGAPRLVINATIPPAKPEVVREIEDITVRSGWSLSIDVATYFRDLDSELSFEIATPAGDALPAGLSMSGTVLTGMLSEVGYYTLKVTATEEVASGEAESVSQYFGIAVEPEPNRFIEPISSVSLGAFGEGAAEISAFDKGSKKLFVTNAETKNVDIIDLTNVEAPEIVKSIDVTTYGGGVNSVAAYDGLLVAAIEADNKQENGKVVAFDTDGTFQWEVTVGALPDMLTFNEDGTKILVANEGEPSDDYTVDPEGTVSIIDVATKNVTTVDFQAYNGQEAQLFQEGVRVFGPNATVAQDLEPEYITVVGDSAYVALQENNAIAIIAISTGELKDIFGLGFKDHNVAGNGLDVPFDKETIYITTLPVKGMYLPDAISGFRAGGKTYIMTANEGDAREYEDGDFLYTDETKIKDVELDPETFDVDLVNELAGNLKITSAHPDTTADGKYKTLYSFGARSFSIWDAETGTQVYDSGDDLEQITAATNPLYFNSTDDEYALKDRSDDKGPEPEAITYGVIGDKTYAFVGLERQGGIMVYDVTNPAAPEFVEYFNNRNFNVEVSSPAAGDHAPEGLVFVPSADSPNGKNLLIVSNEVSGTVTIYSVGEAQNPYTLAIFHNNDGESALLADTVAIKGHETPAGSVAQFKYMVDSLKAQADAYGFNSLMLSSGDNFLPGQTFNASNANGVFYDAMALDAIDYDAICLGNHDFDFGTSVLADFIAAFTTNKAPYLSANLSFENVPVLKALADADRIVPSTVVEKGGEKIGIVGLTTPEITSISSPGNTTVSTDLVAKAQAEIDALLEADVNKIILISHLQGLEQDKELIPQLSGVDIVIAGGGDELLSNDDQLGAPYKLDAKGPYPIVEQDKDGQDVYIVTTPGNYRFLGHLVVDFDADGKVRRVYDSNPVLVSGKADADLLANAEKPVRDYIEDLVTNIVATSEVDLDFRKPSLRTGETNGGNLFADAMLWQAKQTYADFGTAEPHVAIQNGGGLRIEKIIEKGDFNENLTYEVAAFTNIVSVVEEVAPEVFKSLIEHGVADAPVAVGKFPQIAGFKITYDQGKPAGSRVVSITLDDDTEIVKDGAVVDGAPALNVVTIDFLANGGDGYPFGDLDYTTLGATYQQAFLNYLTAEDGLDSLITSAAYPEGMNERILVDKSPVEAVASISEDFDDACPTPDGWVKYNTESDLQFCSGVGNIKQQFNGYKVGAGTSWVIAPRVKVDEGYILSFDYTNKYDGPAPEFVYSTDYVGYGDPADATWTNLTEVEDTIKVATDGWAHVDHIDISTLGTVSFAFRYTSEGESSGQSISFGFDNFMVAKPTVSVLANIEETFDAEIPADWTAYNEGANLLSYSGSQYVDFNGYSVGYGTSWLVAPKVDYSVGTFEMSFDHVTAFSGPEVEVVFSTDYPGYGSPEFYSWTRLVAATDSANVATKEVDEFENTGAIALDVEEAGFIAFRYTSEGSQGGESIRFRVDSIVVRPSNLNPVASDIDDQLLTEGFGAVTLDLTTYFVDADGDDLTFTASSTEETVVTVSVADATLTLTEAGLGASEISVVASDGNGETTSTFKVTVEALPLEANTDADLGVYPNPTASLVYLPQHNLRFENVSVYSVGGQLMAQAKIQDGIIDLRALKSGIYLLHLSDPNSGETMKVRVVKN